MRKKQAFTLIELLVSVAIIALLIGLLLPSLGKARTRAKEAVCLSNLRGLMQAVFLYANDHRERLPGVGLSHGGETNEHGTWVRTLQKHYGDSLIARCPQDDSPHWTLPMPETGLLRQTSYATNYYMAAPVAGRGPYLMVSMSKRPQSTIFLTELAETGAFAASDHVHADDWWSDPRRLAAEQVAYERHGSRSNYGLMDGHAASLPFESTYEIDKKASRLRKIVWLHNMYDPEIGR